jgi:hypothetical protein
MELSGKVKVINSAQAVSDKFTKRELVITTEEQYPQDILIEFHQDKTDLLNAVKVGESVTVGINIRGRLWVSPQGENKYFNTITGWRIAKAKEGLNETAPFQPADYVINDSDTDNLTF